MLIRRCEKVDRYEKNAEREYISDILTYYQSCIHNVERRDVDDDIKYSNEKS